MHSLACRKRATSQDLRISELLRERRTLAHQERPIQKKFGDYWLSRRHGRRLLMAVETDNEAFDLGQGALTTGAIA